MKKNLRADAVEKIRSNIIEHGQHIYLISALRCPRYAYTIGGREAGVPDLIFAGGAYFFDDEVMLIINAVIKCLKSDENKREFSIEKFGNFSVIEVSNTWVSLLTLGAIDFYKQKNIKFLQIIPKDSCLTIDVPDLNVPWDAEKEPIWQWLVHPWNLNFSANYKAITNLAALRGEIITEATRWEEEEWELFSGAGPEVAPKDIRIVPLAVMLGFDKTLIPITTLNIGDGLWRDGLESAWQNWK